MQIQEFDVPPTTWPPAEKKSRRLRVGFWAVALIATVAAVLLCRAYTNRYARVEIAPAAPRSEFEEQVLASLAAGEQAEAEELLRDKVAQLPEALTLTRLLAAGKRQQAERFLQAHSEALLESQRALFLFAACKRSRFDKGTSLLLFDAVRAVDPATPAGDCARWVNRLDTLQPGLLTFFKALHAFREFHRLVAMHPDDLMLRWMLAVQCRSWHRDAEGAELYGQILQQWDPGPVMVHQTYANLLTELGRYDEALRERYKTVEIEPAPWAYDGLGNTLDAMHRVDQALQAHATAVRMRPNHSLYWANYGSSLKRDKQFDAANEKCKRAVELDPRNWRAYWTWGQSLAGQGNLRGALRKYEQGTAIYPGAIYMQKEAAELRRRIATGG